MIANRDVDVITAVVSSINGVLRNKPAMFVWALTISAMTLVGFLTAGLGLIIIIPWLAYATWHGYREALDSKIKQAARGPLVCNPVRKLKPAPQKKGGTVLGLHL